MTSASTDSERRRLAYAEAASEQQNGDLLRLMHWSQLPDWRYELGKWLVNQVDSPNEAAVRGWTDELLLQDVMPYLYAARGNDQMRLALDYPELYWAVQLHGKEENRHKRCVFEAMVVADIDVERIASSFDTTVNAAWMYEQVFFDVRRHLDRPIYMYENVFLPGLRAPGTRHFHDNFWRMLSWKHLLGDKAIKMLVEIGCTMSKQVQDKLNEMREAKSVRDAAIAGFIRQVNQYNAAEVIGEFQRYLELVAGKNPGEHDEDYRRLMKQASALFSVADEQSENVLPAEDVDQSDMPGYMRAIAAPIKEQEDADIGQTGGT